MAKKQQSGVILPSNLSFLRSIEPTSGVMEAVVFNGVTASLHAVFASGNVSRAPVLVGATTVRGTISNDHKEAPHKRVGTGEKALNAPNIATVEQALLPVDAAHLLVTTAIRFSGHALRPAMCNVPEFRDVVAALVTAYADGGGFKALALRYLLNIANGSWLWRNRFGQDIEVRIAYDDAEFADFVEADIDMSQGFVAQAIVDEAKRAMFEQLVDRVAHALAGGPAVTLEVAALVTMGAGAEVFPSQEFSSKDTEKVVKGAEADKVARVLSKQRSMDGSWVATIHARKIGNAIRTIDTWHGQPDVGPIAVEVYGANTHQGEAHRISGNDFYTYFKQPQLLCDQALAGELTDVHHFVVACLVRGGVYGFAEASKAAKASKDESAVEEA